MICASIPCEGLQHISIICHLELDPEINKFLPHILSLVCLMYVRKSGIFETNKEWFFWKRHKFLFIERFLTDLFHGVSSSSVFKNIIRFTEIGCCANVPVRAGCIKGSGRVEGLLGRCLFSCPVVTAAESSLAGALQSKRRTFPVTETVETKEPEALARPGDSWPLVRLLQWVWGLSWPSLFGIRATQRIDQWLKLCLKLYLSALLSTIYWLNSEALWEQNGCWRLQSFSMFKFRGAKGISP